MPKAFTIAKFIFLSVLIVSGLILNLLNFQNTYLGLFFGFYYLLFFGYLTGLVILPEEKGVWQTFFGTIVLIAIIIISGSLTYYFYQLNIAVIITIILLIPLGLLTTLKFKVKLKSEKEKIEIKKPKANLKIFILTLSFLFLEFISFILLFKSTTGQAIRSPWWVVPKEFFLFYFLATVILLIITLYGRRPGKTLLLVIIHYFLSSSVVLIVYRLGYGFDPFIHQATERVIFNRGFILPKPFYYIGQYSLVVILAKIFSLKVEVIDKILVPVLFSITIPTTIYYVFKKITTKNILNTALPLTLLLIPFSSFIVTTPQSLANIFTSMIIITSLVYVALKKPTNWLLILIILTLATLLIHPLAGIPSLIFLGLLVCLPYIKKQADWKNFIQVMVFLIIFLASGLIIPVIFTLNSFLTKSSSIISWRIFSIPDLVQTFNFAIPYSKNHFNLIFDLVYWYGKNVFLFIIFIALISIILLLFKKRFKTFYIYPLVFIILIINYLLLQLTIDFSFLIEYERTNYPARVLEISFYFLLPLIFYAFFQLFKRALAGTLLIKLAVILILSLFITSSMYITYPRDDDYHLDRGYNITQADINAVRYINETAPKNYIVLANQMTSVAAIKEFGFAKYYPAQDDSEKLYFYYPIPTGDPLYQYYLDMVYQKPTKALALEAGSLVGVDTVYLILDSYWWKFDQLVEEAKQQADVWQAIDHGKAYVFRYER
jgi:hypothetical protein